MANETARFLRPYRLPLTGAALLTLLETGLVLARPWPLAFAVTYAVEHGMPPSWLPIRSPQALALIAGLASVGIVAIQGVVACVARIPVSHKGSSKSRSRSRSRSRG